MTLKILEEVSSTSGKNDKLALLKANAGNQELADLLDATFNFNRKYFIKKIPLCKHILRDPRNKHSEFMKLLSDLETGDYRGHAAEEMVKDFLHQCTDEEYKWYSLILQKDIKAGFSAKTAVKAGFKNIPLFDVMLAKDGTQQKNLEALIKKGVWISPKLDGYRCLAIIDEGEVKLYSRNGKEYLNFPTIVESLKQCFPTGKYVFDGEIMSDDFQAMQKTAFANKSNKSVGDVYYSIFGYVPYNEWTSGKFKMLTRERFEMLDQFSKSFDSNLKKTPQHYVEAVSEVYLLQSQYEKAGYEGAMVMPNIPYYKSRKTGGLLKFKTMLSQDCVITGMYEGKSKYEGMMGGVIVRQENGLECECGSGWTDEDRDVMWNNQELYVGNIIEVKYQELTKDGIMRFPVFVRWRNDK